MVKIEDIKNKVGYSRTHRCGYRTAPELQVVREMAELAKPALEVVRDGRVKLHPRSS